MIFLCPKIKGLEPTETIFIASSQISTGIHWRCFCTVNIYSSIFEKVICIFWWKRIGAGFYILFISGLPLELQLLTEEGCVIYWSYLNVCFCFKPFTDIWSFTRYYPVRFHSLLSVVVTICICGGQIVERDNN